MPHRASITTEQIWRILVCSAFVIIILVISGFGYFTFPDYSSYVRLGYKESEQSAFNLFGDLGTTASLICIFAIIALPRFILIKPLIGLLLFQFFCLLSGVWSDVPIETFWYVAKNLLYFFAIAALLMRMDRQAIVKSVIIASLIAGSSSAWVSLTDIQFLDTFGVPGWRGMFQQKNNLGAFCLFTIVLLSSVIFNKVRGDLPLKAVFFTIAFLLVLLVLSNSKTSLALAILYLLASSLSQRIKLERRALITTLILFWILAGSATIYFLADLVASGEVTFTGRTRIWSFYMNVFYDHPIFGAGGCSLPCDDSLTANGTRLVGMPAPDSSYVIILANGGLTGMLLFIAALVLFLIHYSERPQFAVTGLNSIAVFLIFGAMEGSARFALSYPVVIMLIMAFMARPRLHQSVIADSSQLRAVTLKQ